MNLLSEVQEKVKAPAFLDKLGLSPQSEISCSPLGQGEYNANFLLQLPDGEKRVLRLNFGSQMHLEEQIAYEFNALKLLETSGRTPQVYFYDESCQHFSRPYLLMEFLPGRPLRYESDLPYAAAILADIHAVPLPKDHGLIVPEAPAYAIFQECEEMASQYFDWDKGKKEVKELLREMFEVIAKLPLQSPPGGHSCLVNTELNSGNFLINSPKGKDYLIDWEKPLFSEPAQDLAHFLVPTTTFWKTDVILTPQQIQNFYQSYVEAVAGRFTLEGLEERLALYFRTTCLRGISWCSMALREYESPGRSLRNQDTYLKIKSYLEMDFLENILENYMKKDFLSEKV